ncbi:SPX domain-containing protein [Cyathus striatus]|nr:SPX domain-containing protein [Cyathus striatus]
MKFSSSLKFNAVADWWDEYIAYDTLKKYIYQLEKSQSSNIPPTSPTLRNAERDIEAAEPLLSSSLADESATDKIFIPLLDRELKKVTLFYEHQARELAGELDELKDAIVRQEEMGRVGWDEDEESDEDSVEVSRSPERSRRRGSVSASRARRSAEGKRKGYTAATSPSAAAAVHPRRYSVSSLSSHEAEDEHTDLLHDAHLVDSLSSLPHPQQPHTHTRTRSLSLSQSLTLPQRGLHRLVTSLKDSITSHPPTATSPSDVVEGEGGGIWTSRSDYAYDTRLLFKRRITTLFIGFTNLKSYVEVNYSGFRKILKKYDKVTYSSLSQTYMHTRVEPSTPFTSTSKSLLNTHLQTLTDLYAKCVTRSDKAAAKSQLRLHQRENVAWERDTVWRTMIARERAHGGVLMEEKGKGAGWKVGKYTLAKGVFWFGVAVLLGLGAVVWWGNEEGRGEEGRCLGILVFCTVLWASEAIPLFVTSLFVPLLLVLLRIVKDGEGNRMSTPDATKFIFSQMFSPTIMLLIGGFTISSALSKSNIDRVLITRVLALAGTRPSTVLLAFMGVSCFASMWIRWVFRFLIVVSGSFFSFFSVCRCVGRMGLSTPMHTYSVF